MPVRPLLAVLALLPLVGCANDDPRDRAALLALDGEYSGSFTPAAGGAAGCEGDPKPLRMRLADGRVTVEGHGRSRTLSGTVDPDGQVSAQNGRGDRVLSGTVAGDHFTGFLTTAPANNFEGGFGEQGRSCIAQAVAQRGGTAGD